jgi:hypothetical protein
MSHMPAVSQGDATVTALINGSVSLAPAGTPVYSSAAGQVDLGSAAASATALVIGILTTDAGSGLTANVQTSDVVTLTTAQWDARTGATGGLAFGQPYWLDVTAGKLTTTAPATAGRFVTLIGVALSTTQLRLLIQPPIGL